MENRNNTKLNVLHRRLNRLDVHKDAYDAENVIETDNGKELFNHLANELFGNMIPRDPSKKNYKITKLYNTCKQNFEVNTIKYTKTIVKLPISSITIKKSINTIHLPENIKFVVHDVGVNPFYRRSDLRLIITPGTFLDPSSKLDDSKINLNKIYLGFDKILTLNDFIELGINSIIKLESKLNNDRSCDIKIIFNFNDSINIRFNTNFKPIDDNSDFFFGNSTKNQWFNHNILDTNDIELINNSKKYILCKLIGDLLQAYYLKVIFNNNSNYNINNSCLLTVDNNLRIRCILLNIPVIIRNYANKMNEYLYQNTDQSIISEFQSMYLNLVIDHNNMNIQYIKDILNNKKFKINNKIINVNNKINEILLNIIKNIEDANKNISKINYRKYNDLNEYRKAIIKYKTFFIFGLFNEEYILYTNNTTRLFPGNDLKNDIIYKMNKKIDEYIFSLINFSGGNNFGEELETYFNEVISPLKDITDYDKYSSLVDNHMEKDEISKAVQLCIYYNISKIETDPIIIYNEMEVLYTYLVLFYDYIGKTIVDDKFMTNIIKLYRENKLQDITYNEFENMVKEWYKTVSNPDTDPFIGFTNDNNSNNNSENNTETKSKTRKRKIIYVLPKSSKKYKNITKKIRIKR
jgi:hypothetical protein